VATELDERRLVTLDVDGLPVVRQWFVLSRNDKVLLPPAQPMFDFLKRQGRPISHANPSQTAPDTAVCAHKPRMIRPREPIAPPWRARPPSRFPPAPAPVLDIGVGMVRRRGKLILKSAPIALTQPPT